jgi:HD-like signal output (HDOD) protein
MSPLEMGGVVEDPIRAETLQNLDDWIRRLNNQEMPILAGTAARIAGIAEKDRSNCAQMACAILEDASLTSRILKVANSAYYMAGRGTGAYPSASRSTNTVSRAVLLLGFDTVRSMCQSMSVIETLVKGIQRGRLAKEMARAFHAAVQARWLAAARKDRCPEEVFIATLLYQLGNMVFWCFADRGLVQKMEAATRASGHSNVRAEMEILGFPLQQLTARLGKEWHLGELLQDALDESRGTNPRVKSIVLGYRLAQGVEQGWDTQEMKELTKQVADLLALPEEKVAHGIRDNAMEATQTAASWGVPAAGRLIPLPSDFPKGPVVSVEKENPSEPEKPRFFQPDPLLQLRILRELSTLLVDQKPDYNLFLSVAMEGIFRGIGMDRILFALLSKNRRSLEVKYAVGWGPEEKVQGVIFDSSLLQRNLFGHILKAHQPLWIQTDPGEEVSKLLTEDITSITGGAPFYLMPIVVSGKAIGLIYADRHTSGRDLDDDSFASFQHFCQQTNIGLSFISQQGISLQ